MAIFTFSTKGTKPQDTETVERVKEACDSKNMNFSGLIITLLKKWEADNESRRNKV